MTDNSYSYSKTFEVTSANIYTDQKDGKQYIALRLNNREKPLFRDKFLKLELDTVYNMHPKLLEKIDEAKRDLGLQGFPITINSTVTETIQF